MGDYRAHALAGEPGLVNGRHYVSFAGDTAFVDWLPGEEALTRYLGAEKVLLSQFQLNVVNFEHVLVGFSGRQLDQQIDAAMLNTLQRVGYRVVSIANNHALDAGPRGVSFSATGLARAGFQIIGLRSHPLFFWDTGGRRIAIFSLTAYTDRDDERRLTLRLDDPDLALIHRLTAPDDFRIAFVHLGSMSSFPSEHERSEVARLIDAGADLVVCTGSHFIKGFIRERGTPVFYGLGDHLLSSVNAGTENVGMHAVAGFAEGQLKQLFVVPFWNDIHSGRTGPLDSQNFQAFLKTFRDRSTPDTSRYYTDPRSRSVLRERLRHLRLSDLRQIRGRQVVYGARIVWHNYPLAVVGFAALAVVAVVVLLQRVRRSRGRRVSRVGEGV